MHHNIIAQTDNDCKDFLLVAGKKSVHPDLLFPCEFRHGAHFGQNGGIRGGAQVLYTIFHTKRKMLLGTNFLFLQNVCQMTDGALVSADDGMVGIEVLHKLCDEHIVGAAKHKAFVGSIPGRNQIIQIIAKFIGRGIVVDHVGKTGAGKSSAIKLLTGEIKPTSGDVIVDGIVVNSLKRKKIPYLRRAQGVVFQDFRLLPNKTVYENVAFAMEIIGKTKKEISRKVPKILALVGLSERANNFPHEISGGEQQRVSIARAIVNSPSLIIADEPTGNLDVETSNGVMELFDKINKMGTTIVMVTHSEKIVNDMCKRVIQLDNGTLVRDEENGVYNLGV